MVKVTQGQVTIITIVAELSEAKQLKEDFSQIQQKQPATQEIADRLKEIIQKE